MTVVAAASILCPGAIAINRNVKVGDRERSKWSERIGEDDRDLTHLLAKDFVPAPERHADEIPTGFVYVFAEHAGNSSRHRIVHDLRNVDGQCFTYLRSDPYSCAVYIAEGNPCDGEGERRPRFMWERNPQRVASNPWEGKAGRYRSKLIGDLGEDSEIHERICKAHGVAELDMGVDVERIKSGTVVVHNYMGDLVACSRIDTMKGCDTKEGWNSRGVIDFTLAFDECGTDLYCTARHPDCFNVCRIGEDCEWFPMRVCDDSAHMCRHKKLFEGTAGAAWIDIASGVIFAAISGMSMSVGIGGGGLFVPLLALVLHFDLREATAISQALLAGGSSTALMYNLRQRHPSGRKPMINYDLVLVMGPALLIGAFFGSFLHSAMPLWFILLLLDIVLCYSCVTSFRKGFDTWRRERDDQIAPPQMSTMSSRRSLGGGPSTTPNGGSAAAAERRAEALEAGAGNADGLTPTAKAASEDPAAALVSPTKESPTKSKSKGRPGALEVEDGMAHTASQISGGSGSTRANRAPKQPRQPQFPVFELSLFGATWAVVLAMTFARGGKGAKGLVELCSPAYWAICATTAVFLACVSACGARRASLRNRHLLGLPAAGELVYDARTVARITLGSVAAGTLAAMCGIGGGMVMAPILIDLGVLPQVQSASMGLTLFVISSTTAFFYIVQGMALPDYSLYLAVATGVGAVVGRQMIGWLFRTVVRPSIVMFLLALMVTAATLQMTWEGGNEVFRDISHGQLKGFQSFCE